MARRLWFPDTQPAPVTPPAPSGTDWEHVNSVQRALLLAPDGSALATTAYAPDAADDLTDKDSHHRQYVGPCLAAQTLSGNVTAQLQCQETFNNDNLFLALKILVCNRAGSSTAATLLAITRATSAELSSSADANRTFPSTALSSFACADGDRLVVEVGLGGSISSGVGGIIGHNGQIRWGCAATSGDLPVDESTTTATFRGWIEFSADFAWEATGEDTNLVIARTRFSEW